MALALALAVGLLLGAQASSDCDAARPHKGSKRRDVVRFLFVCFWQIGSNCALATLMAA